jgi:hypothetical protein
LAVVAGNSELSGVAALEAAFSAGAALAFFDDFVEAPPFLALLAVAFFGGSDLFAIYSPFRTCEFRRGHQD